MLTVYRASAGSVKTHLLTGFYINLLFSNETGFSNILAVTFTNKATEEMKERIVKDLFTLSSMPENSDYFEKISADYNLSAEEIKQKATKFLIEILHNYSYFNVSTIDHFFQQTTRAFTREIGLQGGYNVELDQNKVLEEAIDALFSNLYKKE